ncbi:hypothetical protein Tco_0714503 [Tanacetum coccineum]
MGKKRESEKKEEEKRKGGRRNDREKQRDEEEDKRKRKERQRKENIKCSREAGLSKDTSGPEPPLELRRSWLVEGHDRSRVIRSVLMQWYQMILRQKLGDEDKALEETS